MRRIKDNIIASDVKRQNVTSGGWGRAAAEAKAQLADMRVRVARLKAAIKLFSEKEKNGDPWLEEYGQIGYTVTQKAGTNEKSVPAEVSAV